MRRALWVISAGSIVGVLMAWWSRSRRMATDCAEGSELGTQSAAYAERLLISSREELGRADTKASILLATAAAVIAAVVAGVVAGGWSPAMLTGWYELLWWVSTGLAGLAMLLLAGAVYPRTAPRRDGQPTVVAYYGDVVQFNDHSALRAALERSAPRDIDRLTDQIYHVSRIVRRKYRLIRDGMWTLLAATLGSCLAVGLQMWRT